ncbi:MAG: hypothetical protein L0Y74_01780 [candidate division Zixibacteria bacterium]|nr:hypothetical protein [candidate division Zixibacteria bacterium]
MRNRLIALLFIINASSFIPAESGENSSQQSNVSPDSALLVLNDWIGRPEEEAFYDTVLTGLGVQVQLSDTLYANLSNFKIVILGSYPASNPTTSESLENYLNQGGGILLIAGVPDYLGMPDYIGASEYINAGGTASTVTENPFCPDLDSGLVLVSGVGSSAAALRGPSQSAQVLAVWNEDTSVIFSLANQYGSGKVFYQSGTPIQVPGCPECGTKTEDWVTLTEQGIYWLLDYTAIPGDANADGTLTLVDIILVVRYVLQLPPHPSCTEPNSRICWLSGLLCRGDWNGSSTVTLSDAIYGVNYLFNRPGGPWDPLPVGPCCQPAP